MVGTSSLLINTSGSSSAVSLPCRRVHTPRQTLAGLSPPAYLIAFVRQASRAEGRWKEEEREGAGRPGNLHYKRRRRVGAFAFGHLYLETLCLAPSRPQAREKERPRPAAPAKTRETRETRVSGRYPACLAIALRQQPASKCPPRPPSACKLM